MEPENIAWDKIDSIFVRDDTYENFEAPKWVDLSADLDQLPVVDDESWFCTQDCKHPKTAEDFLKPRSTSNSKSKLLRLKTISEILPFRDRTRRGNYSATESFYAKLSENSSAPNSCSRSFRVESENKNPNFSAPIPKGGTNNKTKKKPVVMRPSKENPNPNPKHLNGSMVEEEGPGKSERKPQLKSTFSAQNLLGGREILSQITGFCSELKRLAMKGSKKGGATEKGPSPSGVSEEGKPKDTALHRERVPLLVVKERKGSTLSSGT